MGVSADSNVYHRRTPSFPTWIVVWSRGPGNPSVFTTLGLATTATGQETKGREYIGASIVDRTATIFASWTQSQASLPSRCLPTLQLSPDRSVRGKAPRPMVKPSAPILSRVLVVNPGADIYGSDLQVLESVKGLVAAGVSVDVVVPDPGPLVGMMEEAGAAVEILEFPVVRRSYLSAAGLVRLTFELARAAGHMSRLLRDTSPAWSMLIPRRCPGGLSLSRLHRVPVICHVHEAEDADSTLVLKTLNAPLLLADHIILISQLRPEQRGKYGRSLNAGPRSS